MADLSLRTHDKAGHTTDLWGQSPLPGMGIETPQISLGSAAAGPLPGTFSIRASLSMSQIQLMHQLIVLKLGDVAGSHDFTVL